MKTDVLLIKFNKFQDFKIYSEQFSTKSVGKKLLQLLQER